MFETHLQVVYLMPPPLSFLLSLSVPLLISPLLYFSQSGSLSLYLSLAMSISFDLIFVIFLYR